MCFDSGDADWTAEVNEVTDLKSGPAVRCNECRRRIAENEYGQHLHARCNTPESCALANELICEGRWHVTHCGRCDSAVTDADVDDKCECEVPA